MSAVYTPEQVGQFLNYIDIPAKYRLENNPPRDYGFLKALHIHMITAVPYENLTLHYSAQRKVNIDPQVVFQKIVGDARGRGGYCVENSLLYLYMLRAIGFRVYPVGVKIRYREDGVPKGDYAGWYVRHLNKTGCPACELCDVEC
jgi:arylamine N-acetyltransferase